jgi:hypothetical protein
MDAPADPVRRWSLQKPETEQTAKVAAREIRARDAALAMQEYQAETLSVRLRTEQLRALRLAKEGGAVAPGKSAGQRQNS